MTVYQDKEKGFFHREVAFVYCHNVNMLLLALGIKSIIPCLGGCSLTHQNKVSNEICNNGMNKLNEPWKLVCAYFSGALCHKEKSQKCCLKNYYVYQWIICVDPKIVNFLLGQQSGYTEFPCFLCWLDSRVRERPFLNLSEENATAGIFDRPQIQKF